MTAPPLPGDQKAGFIGLAVAIVFLLIFVTGIVFITNRLTGHHEEPAPAAQQQEQQDR